MTSAATDPLRPNGLPFEIPFIESLGVVFHEAAPGHSLLTLDSERRHQNSFGVVHGGVVLTLMDVAMAMAARSAPDAHGGEARGMVTIEMKTSFLQPTQGRVEVRGVLVHRTPTMALCEAFIDDAQGKPVARASGTFKTIRPRDLGAS
jgi:uncharacterized protein (TIGR00369 family)